MQILFPSRKFEKDQTKSQSRSKQQHNFFFLFLYIISALELLRKLNQENIDKEDTSGCSILSNLIHRESAFLYI